MQQPRRKKVIALALFSAAAMLLAACEGLDLATPAPGTPKVESTQALSATATPAAEASETATEQAPAISRSPVTGGRSLPTRTVGSLTVPTPGRTIIPLRPTPTTAPGPLPTRSIVPTRGLPPTAFLRPTSTPLAEVTATSTLAAGGTPSATSTPRPTTTPAATSTPFTRADSPGGTVRTSAPVDLSFYEGGQLVVGGTVLASLTPAGHAFDSVCNDAGLHGSSFGGTSIFNDLTPYGGPFGENSPFNPASTSPPQIVVAGMAVGHLTVSPFVSDPVDPYAMLEHLGCPVAPG